MGHYKCPAAGRRNAIRKPNMAPLSDKRRKGGGILCLGGGGCFSCRWIMLITCWRGSQTPDVSSFAVSFLHLTSCHSWFFSSPVFANFIWDKCVNCQRVESRGLCNHSPLVGHSLVDCFMFLGPSLQPCGPGVLSPWGGAVHFELPHSTPAPGPLHKLLYCLSLSYLLGVPP